MTKPNFLYIGGPRSGSTWLFEALREHPEVFVPPAKDIYFFDKNWERGVSWYFQFFEAAEGKKAIGELSHDYFLQEQTAERINQVLPEVRIIACLRNPLEAVVSLYEFRKHMDLGSKVTLSEFAAKEAVEYFDFYKRLRPFFDRFDRNRILVLFYDELVESPSSFIKRVYQFLSVDEEYQPSVLHKKVLARPQARNLYIAQSAYRIAHLLKYRLGMSNFVGVMKSTPIVHNLFFKTDLARTEKLDQQTQDKLYAVLSRDYSKLGKLIHQDVPRSWLKSIEPDDHP